VIEKELAEGQLYTLSELTISQQEKARPEENAQTSAQTPSQVRLKKLAEGQLYQELGIRQQQKARPEENAQTSAQTPGQV